MVYSESKFCTKNSKNSRDKFFKVIAKRQAQEEVSKAKNGEKYQPNNSTENSWIKRLKCGLTEFSDFTKEKPVSMKRNNFLKINHKINSRKISN